MNILSLSPKIPYPPKDGGAIGILNIAMGLAAADVNLTMLAFNTKKHYFPPEDIPAEITRQFRIIPVDIDTTIRPVKALKNLLFSKVPYIAERFLSEDYSQELVRLLKEQKFDLIQLEGPYMGQYIPEIRKHSNCSIALRAHNAEFEIWERKAAQTKGILKKIYLRNLSKRIRQLEMQVVNLSDMIVPVTARDAETLLNEMPGKPSLVIPAVIDMNDYACNLPGVEMHEMCFIGALDWLPNQEGLYWMKDEVIPLLYKEMPDATLHVAGRNMSASFAKHMSHPAIRLTGEVENAKEFMQSFRIMVVPLLSGSGIRVKIIEAMGLGMCVITTTLGAEGLNVTDGNQLLIADTGKDFAVKIRLLMEHPTLYKEISENAKKFVRENFDTFEVTRKMAAFYKSNL